MLDLQVDTRFRSALQRMAARGRLATHEAEVDWDLELASIMKKFDGDRAIAFPRVKGYGVPVVGNVLCGKANCEAAFGVDFRDLRQLISRGLDRPIPPVNVDAAPAQEVIRTKDIDLARDFPVLRHTPADGGRFITSGVVIVRDPETGVYNASYHRLQLAGPDRTLIQLDYGRHLRNAFERAQKLGKPLPIAVCIGTDLSVQLAAATMGSRMPESASELAAAGGVCGKPIPLVRAVTQDLFLPAETEIVIEGVISHDTTQHEGPFGEFVGFLSPPGDAPVIAISAVTHRREPIWHAINGYGRETIMLRKYVLEASLLSAMQPAFPFLVDAEMTAGGLHRFHAVIQVKKTMRQHDGLQRNAMLGAFATLKDLDMVICVDHDIDIQDPADVEYALATRFEASQDIIVIPGARGHEYVRASKDGIRAKLALDCTVPFEQQARFTRAKFSEVSTSLGDLIIGDKGSFADYLNGSKQAAKV